MYHPRMSLDHVVYFLTQIIFAGLDLLPNLNFIFEKLEIFRVDVFLEYLNFILIISYDVFRELAFLYHSLVHGLTFCLNFFMPFFLGFGYAIHKLFLISS